mmetsp:Transcript_3002/g.3941  ORF Transcript_3002/g.3941 Transcript_3002/m.3941 type:complete len:210 (-) Transcript_3002:137-766(-)
MIKALKVAKIYRWLDDAVFRRRTQRIKLPDIFFPSGIKQMERSFGGQGTICTDSHQNLKQNNQKSPMDVFSKGRALLHEEFGVDTLRDLHELTLKDWIHMMDFLTIDDINILREYLGLPIFTKDTQSLERVLTVLGYEKYSGSFEKLSSAREGDVQDIDQAERNWQQLSKRMKAVHFQRLERYLVSEYYHKLRGKEISKEDCQPFSIEF